MISPKYLENLKKEEQEKFNDPEKHFSIEQIEQLAGLDFQKYGDVANAFRAIFFKDLLTKIKREQEDITPQEAVSAAAAVCNDIATEYCRTELGQ